jgi:2-hydroxy-3-keto-5-methylthiopentenyl-1-phosphate phosphatase
MPKQSQKIAICYDFDGTLAPGNMHEHSLLPVLGIKKEKFWSESNKMAKDHNMSGILSYMFLTLDKAKTHNHSIKRKSFSDHGKNIRLFKGLNNYFKSINKYAKRQKVSIEHYIISSGLKEIIEGTSIRKQFKYIFASEFMYNVDGIASWPALAIDYTNKTQYLFRINKGILNSWDNDKINKYTPEADRPIPFSRIIYIGDGETDIPAMKMVNFQGGYSIAVYDPKKRHSYRRKSPKDICLELVNHRRASFIAPADYRQDKLLFKLLKIIINKIMAESEMSKVQLKYKKEIESAS